MTYSSEQDTEASKSKADHCVFQNNVLLCLHCKGTFNLPLPMDVNELAKKTKAFIALHKDCKEQP
jgi:hypothetical protein